MTTSNSSSVSLSNVLLTLYVRSLKVFQSLVLPKAVQLGLLALLLSSLVVFFSCPKIDYVLYKADDAGIKFIHGLHICSNMQIIPQHFFSERFLVD